MSVPPQIAGPVDLTSWIGHVSHRRLTVFLRSPTQRGQCLATSVLGVELSKKLHHTVTQSHLISLFSEWCSLLICAERPPETLFYSRENLRGLCRPGAGVVRLHHALRSGGLFLSKMFQSHLPACVQPHLTPVSRDT